MSGKDVKTFSDAIEKDQTLKAKFADLMKKAHAESIKLLVVQNHIMGYVVW